MKKAVITTGGKQYIVAEGDELNVELLKLTEKKIILEPLMTINGETISIGKPSVSDSKVTAEVIEQEVKADKVTAIRYKPKKRVHKVRGHRQRLTRIKITKIA